MTFFPRAIGRLAPLLISGLLFSSSLAAQGEAAPPTPPAPVPAPAPAPRALQTGEETPWLYRGSDIPQDKAWLFGEMDNGLRYAVREHGVPPGQVSIRIRIDAGSLYEKENERGYAHLLEHLLFRESKYLGQAEAVPTWQRLGATFGRDTNAETSPTQTVYKLDLPNVDAVKLDETFKLLSGMVRAPVLSDANIAAEVPIVMAEKRLRGGAAEHSAEVTRQTLFAGQLLATRSPIGTPETLNAATAASVSAFYRRWYRPENTLVVAVGDVDPKLLAALVEKWFGDWAPDGPHTPAPDFGDPAAPAAADAANPVGKTAVVVEPDLPRSFTYAVLRPWRPVQDTIVYNQGLLRDALAMALINRRLENRARGGGSFLYAQVQQEDVSRSTDATFVSFAPLTKDWRAALHDVRAVIADALTTPPTKEELAREIAEFELAFASSVEQESVRASSMLANNMVQAVDIRETVASPETVQMVFRGMKATITPEQILEHTRALFSGAVLRGVYGTPATGEASAQQVRTALLQPVEPDSSARLTVNDLSFDDLPPIGEPGKVLHAAPIGVLEIEQVEFSNGVKAILWANDAEPGRVSVKVRFGGGLRAFDAGDAPYIALGRMALVESGIGELGQRELDLISTGRQLGFEFTIAPDAFEFSARTRAQDLAPQLYLFAGKLAMPRWDADPVKRALAAARLAYESYAASPAGVLERDLEYLLHDSDPRYATPDLAMLKTATPEGFRKVWEPLLGKGKIEVLVFGDFDRDAAVAALARTFGALPVRQPISAEVAARVPPFAEPGPTKVLYHHGDANQAAAVVAWPSGGGVEHLRESRQLEILVQVFNNRLMEALRERAGASYAPSVHAEWPKGTEGGGQIIAAAMLKPEAVPIFFHEAQRIATDLQHNPPTADELTRVTEPFRQSIDRASTGNLFWMHHLEGMTRHPALIAKLRSLLVDYTQTSPAVMQALARKYFGSTPGWRLAVIPKGQELATQLPDSVNASR